jgi:dipeptidyl aminopeptidase/acylaminoacyl peptidase
MATEGSRPGYAAVAALANPGAPPTLTGLRCHRIHMAAGTGLCLADGDLFTPYKALVVGPDFQPRHELALAGLPSRARVSPDGRMGAATVFVTGHSYAEGSFSTQTTIIDMATGKVIGDLERFAVYRNGSKIHSVDFNFWGVTFAQGGRFYATLGTAGHTYLVRGDIAARTVEVLRDGVECPSLSPDGRRIAFKQKVAGNPAVTWRLAVLDLDTLADHTLAEARDVDDQAEWLDDNRILYAVDTGEGPPQTWSVPADGSGRPEPFLPAGDSPAVIR